MVGQKSIDKFGIQFIDLHVFSEDKFVTQSGVKSESTKIQG